MYLEKGGHHVQSGQAVLELKSLAILKHSTHSLTVKDYLSKVKHINIYGP